MRILETKLHPPTPLPQTLIRERLFKLIEAGLAADSRLTLVAAPAGFGKSTLVATWLQQQATQTPPPHIAWLSLDAQDGEPRRFWRYVAAALQHADIDLPPFLIAAEPPDPEFALTELVHALTAVSHPIYLILEDYHLLESAAVDAALTFLVNHTPPNFHVLLISRIDPDLPLSRWRVQRQLTEVRADDLRFSIAEIAAFLKATFGLQLSHTALGQLQGRTEGWAASLQLAGLSLQQHSQPEQFVTQFSGSHRFVIDYLTDEVLQQLGGAEQQFLLETSLLERFCAPLCDALRTPEAVAHTLSATMLAELERRQLFIIPLDDNRHWYRYHHLFADLLRSRLLQQQPERVVHIRRQAARWFGDHQLWDEGLQQAEAAQAGDICVILLRAMAWEAFHTARVVPVLGWHQRLEPLFGAEKGRMQIWAGWLHLYTAAFDAIPDPLPPLDEGWEPLSQAMWHGLDGFLALQRGTLEHSIQAFESGLALLDGEWHAVVHTLTVMLGRALLEGGDMSKAYRLLMSVFGDGSDAAVTVLLGLYFRMQSHTETYAMAERILDNLEGASEILGPDLAWNHIFLARDAFFRNQLPQALALTERAVALTATAVPHSGVRLSAQMEAVRVYLATGRRGQAWTTARIMWEHAQELAIWAKKSIVAILMVLYILDGDLAAAEKLAHEYEFTDIKGVMPSLSYSYSVYAELLHLQGRDAEALRILRLIEQIEATLGFPDRVITTYVQLANSLLALDREAEARQQLRHALKVAEPLSYVRCFLSVAPTFKPLLRSLRLEYPTFADDILRLLNEDTPNQQLLEPLSERELEVLRLIGQGYSNREIAEQLVVAQGTVKRHAANIYGKLGVSSRTAAVARARELGILIA